MASDPYSQGASELIGLIGAGVQAHSNSQKKQDLQNLMGDFQPNYDQYTSDYFNNLQKYAPQAEQLSADIGKSSLNSALALREQALPGIGKATQSTFQQVLDLIRGNDNSPLVQAFLRSSNLGGAASSVGSGYGGSPYGAVTQGVFGAGGALKQFSTGVGLLQALMGTLPQVNAPSTQSFLSNIITPQQRVGDQLQFRQQQLGLGTQIAGMPSAADSWANYVESVAGANSLGGGSGGMGSFGGGGNGTPGYQGSSGGAQYYNVPTNNIWGGGGAINGGWSSGSTAGGFA